MIFIPKRLLGCWLILGLIVGLISLSPETAEARGRNRNRTSSSRKSSKSNRSSRNKSNRSSKTRGSKSNRAHGGRRGRHGRAAVVATPHRSSLPASAIPPDRVREIQTALQREGYLQSDPSGQYDKATVEAMSNYQRDHNLRSTGYPTAESLQKLGLTRQRRVNPPANPGTANPGENRPNGTTGAQTLPKSAEDHN